MSDVQRLREAEMLDITDHDRRGMVRAVILPCEWSAICDVLEAAEEAYAHADDVVPDGFRCECYTASEIRKRFSESLVRLHDQLEAQS